MSYTDEIKIIISEYVQTKYHDYLNNKQILLIKEEYMEEEVSKIYDENFKLMKPYIRNKLKENHKEDYNSGLIENILLDIFQDRESNIFKIIEEIKIIQKKNYKLEEVPIVNNSLNLNIGLNEHYVLINSTKNKESKYNELYETISKYKFLYSINDKILEEYDANTKIKLLKDEIQDKSSVKIGLYYLK